ncbi:DegT/DnrJ/EryC1/StrS family aminotransferase [Flavicella sediminum]|uniref:DegT/DnrJ/EryC1/StrS family aminotransferase n=1 Tax=Flavicella sediminum TaxID=2585141 RepID=UPI00111D9317|nr:DegT/DnrJ/EryC1/StrS family aminotransferase [Flavicella sediminum]
MIPVTKPFLPPKEEYNELISGIWKRGWLTNMGPLANELEATLQKHLQVNHLLYVTNGTIALQMAIKALGLKGEILTTPFSFIATTSSIVWENCTPVFVDIDEQSLNIDAAKIEAAITENTTAILATHVYGNPCDVIAIEKIANKHNLKVIYDGAHAFGVKVHGKSIFEYGDISTCSLHATKLYHSIEGGFVVTNDKELSQKLAKIRNFGFDGPESFAELGINGKNSEYHAAMGLVNYKHIEAIHNKRKKLTEAYLTNLQGLAAVTPIWHSEASKNYAYFPLVFETEEFMLKCIDVLKENEIFARRYFYPSLANSLPYLDPISLKVTDAIAKRVLCLPLYFKLSNKEVNVICEVLLSIKN